MSKQYLNNKTVVVIGGSSGIGLAVSQLAYERGANVTLTSRDAEKATTVAKSIHASVNGQAVDINDEAAVNEFFKPFTQIDHIYIAAGATQLGPLTEGDLSQKLQAFETRLYGSLRIIKAVVNKMNVGGSIVFTGGVSTDRPITSAWVSGLGTSSAEQLARVMVMEYPHIRFNAVAPGYTDTPMWDAIMGENKTSILANIATTIPVKKIASAEEVASAVLFLFSNESITGEIIHIDGGMRLV